MWKKEIRSRRALLETDDYQHRAHNKNLLYLHLIFVAKYRKKLLAGPLNTDIMQYMYDACQAHHWYVRRMQSDKDHLHMLIQYNPTDSISGIVRTLKQISTHRAWQNYSGLLSKQYWKEHTLWSDGYFAASVGNASRSTIEHYIENQG